MPTKVTGHSGGDKTKDIGILEFWNVGKLGGEQYSKATYIISRDDKTIQTFEGYFTGGPNGDINVTATYHGKTQEMNFKLIYGEEIDFYGTPIPIDNPEAFNGWVD
ncbi:MAG: hypothetical protein ACYDIA_05680 [Candidatus Humimicrobiaceae bacterium]